MQHCNNALRIVDVHGKIAFKPLIPRWAENAQIVELGLEEV